MVAGDSESQIWLSRQHTGATEPTIVSGASARRPVQEQPDQATGQWQCRRLVQCRINVEHMW
jgi:hypothetical protein